METLRVLNVNVCGCRLSSPSNVTVVAAANYTICSQRMLDPTFINISNSHNNKLNLTTWVYFGSVEGVERSFPGRVSFPPPWTHDIHSKFVRQLHLLNLIIEPSTALKNLQQSPYNISLKKHPHFNVVACVPGLTKDRLHLWTKKTPMVNWLRRLQSNCFLTLAYIHINKSGSHFLISRIAQHYELGIDVGSPAMLVLGTQMF